VARRGTATASPSLRNARSSGSASAKPFWLAFWLPTSLLIGLIVALRSSSEFDREVVELGTGRGRVRARWRDFRAADAFVAAVREKRPDLQAGHGVVPGTFARDYSPRLSVGGGFPLSGSDCGCSRVAGSGCSCWTSPSTAARSPRRRLERPSRT
jgi:hypothetical protein